MAMSSAQFSNISTSVPSNRPRPTLAQVGLGIVICLVAAGLGFVFTSAGLHDWYPTLVKPPHITPPDWVFGPVWTVLYVMMGISLAYLFAIDPKQPGRQWAMNWFWIQLALNVGWCAAFFTMRSPGWGYLTICLLWLAIVALFWTASKLSRAAVLLLVPYFLWVTFASCLNFGILGYNVLKPKVEAMDRDPRNQDPRYKLADPKANPTPIQLN